MTRSTYPLWTVPVAPGHSIANVTEYRDGGFVTYAQVGHKVGFAQADWDRFVLDTPAECTCR